MFVHEKGTAISPVALSRPWICRLSATVLPFAAHLPAGYTLTMPSAAFYSAVLPLVWVSFAGLTQAASQQPASAAQPPVLSAPQAPSAAPASVTPVARNESWWKDRHAAMAARVEQGAADGETDLLFIGDSITQGWEGEGKGVWEEHYAKHNPINLGIGGDRTEHVLYRLQHLNLAGLAKPKVGTPPKVAVVMIGTNNVGDTPPNETAAGIAAIVRLVELTLPTTQVLLLGIFPREEHAAFARKRNNEVNALLETAFPDEAGAGRVHYVNIGGSFMQADGSISKEVMPDFLHLSARGYGLWQKAIDHKLMTLLSKQQPPVPADQQPARPPVAAPLSPAAPPTGK